MRGGPGGADLPHRLAHRVRRPDAPRRERRHQPRGHWLAPRFQVQFDGAGEPVPRIPGGLTAPALHDDERDRGIAWGLAGVPGPRGRGVMQQRGGDEEELLHQNLPPRPLPDPLPLAPGIVAVIDPTTVVVPPGTVSARLKCPSACWVRASATFAMLGAFPFMTMPQPFVCSAAKARSQHG